MTGITPVAFTCRRREPPSPGLQLITASESRQVDPSKTAFPRLDRPLNRLSFTRGGWSHASTTRSTARQAADGQTSELSGRHASATAKAHAP